MSCGPCDDEKRIARRRDWRRAFALFVLLVAVAGAWLLDSTCADAQSGGGGRGCGPCNPWFMPTSSWTINDGPGNTLFKVRDNGADGIAEARRFWAPTGVDTTLGTNGGEGSGYVQSNYALGWWVLHAPADGLVIIEEGNDRVATFDNVSGAARLIFDNGSGADAAMQAVTAGTAGTFVFNIGATGGSYEFQFGSVASSGLKLTDIGTTAALGVDSYRPLTASGPILFEDQSGDDLFEMENYASDNIAVLDARQTTILIQANDSNMIQCSTSSCSIAPPLGAAAGVTIGGGEINLKTFLTTVTGSFAATVSEECLEITQAESGVVANMPCSMSGGSLTASSAGLRFHCDTDTDEVNVVLCCAKAAGCSSVGSTSYYVRVDNFTP